MLWRRPSRPRTTTGTEDELAQPSGTAQSDSAKGAELAEGLLAKGLANG